VFVIVEGFYDIKFYLRADLCKIPAGRGWVYSFWSFSLPLFSKNRARNRFLL